MNTRIGEFAGILWRILGRRGQLPLDELFMEYEGKAEHVLFALGWLAREGKVLVQGIDDENPLVSLNPDEQRVFDSLCRQEVSVP